MVLFPGTHSHDPVMQGDGMHCCLLQLSAPEAKFRIPRLNQRDVKSQEKLWRPQSHLAGSMSLEMGEDPVRGEDRARAGRRDG